jgi:hypothetical protein
MQFACQIWVLQAAKPPAKPLLMADSRPAASYREIKTGAKPAAAGPRNSQPASRNK